jgi:hypothetical protein
MRQAGRRHNAKTWYIRILVSRISDRNSGRTDAPIAVRAEKLETVTLRFTRLKGSMLAPIFIF